MKKLLLFFILFSVLFSNTYALKIDKFSYTDKDFSVSKETQIINHNLEIYKKIGDRDILGEKKNKIVNYLEEKIGVKKTQNLFKNNILHLAGNSIKQDILSKISENTNSENINLLSFNHSIEITNKNREDTILNFFPIKDYKFLDDFYFQSFIRNSYSSGSLGFSQVLIFDDILLPKNLKVTFYYSNDTKRTSKYIKYSEENLEVEKKYFFREYNYLDNQYTLIIPYFEIKIPFSKSQTTSESSIKDDLYISYDIIEDMYYSQYIPIIKNGEKASLFEYEKY